LGIAALSFETMTVRNLELVSERPDGSRPKLEMCEPCMEDGQELEKLVKECHPLEDNSIYAYLLLCTHFHKTCIVAKHHDQIVGFVSAYIKPEQRNTLFIWQVAVKGDWRKHGLALKMIRHLLKRPYLRDLKYIEATVTASNRASKNLFMSIAKTYETRCETQVVFSKELFDGNAHEDEYLFRIGPIKLTESEYEFDDFRSIGIPGSPLRTFFPYNIF
jgi:L-2,4-diaminobutyric acid acetyltransferase